MYVIVGLGNPGREYENTRHNIGFITIDRLAEKYSIRVNRIKHKALVGSGYIDGEKVLLVKPQTYMNLSGESVREIVSYYKVPIENLLVIYDDLDIERGMVRVRSKGSAGTHNGMRSIIYQIRDENFPRIRIGIGDHRDDQRGLADYVIGGFTKEEVPIMEEAVKKACRATELYISKGIEIAMNRINKKAVIKKEKKEEVADQSKAD